MNNDRFLTLEAVLAKTTLSKSALYRLPDFPKAARLGPRTKAWSENEINAWMARVRGAPPSPEQAGVSDDLAAAVRLRDLVLPVLRKHGLAVRDGLFNAPALTLGINEFRLSLIGPYRLQPEDPTSHRLGVWHGPFGIPVLFLDWSETEDATLRAFAGGTWDHALFAALALLPNRED